MKTLFKSSTDYSQKTLKEAYSTLWVSKIWISLTILSTIAIILAIISSFKYNYNDPSQILLLIFPLITWLCATPFARAKFDSMAMRAHYRSDDITKEISFDNDKISIFNTTSKWTINVNYSQCNKIYETKNLFVIVYNQRFLILIDKDNFKIGEQEKFVEFIKVQLQPNKKDIINTLSI